MNAHMIPNHLPEPPPVPRNDFPLDLLDGDRVVGWITPATIGFTGFATETEAAHAAWVAYRALARDRRGVTVAGPYRSTGSRYGWYRPRMSESSTAAVTALRD